MDLNDLNLAPEPKLFDGRKVDTIVSSEEQSGFEDEKATSRGGLQSGQEGFGCAAVEGGRGVEGEAY